MAQFWRNPDGDGSTPMHEYFRAWMEAMEKVTEGNENDR